MDIVLGSVVYSQALNYISDFFDSLKNQTVQDFDIILLNDDIDEAVWKERFEVYIDFFGCRLNVVNMKDFMLEPYQLRIELIKIAKKNHYGLLVLSDCDDKCSDNRIEKVKNAYALETCDFFYNEIENFSNERVMPPMPIITDSIQQIQEENYLGLSNTALVLDKMSNEFIESLYEGKTRIFDWYLFSRILLEGGIGKKIEATVTYYRIHQNNLAGISGNSLNELIKELQIKKQHYKMLKKYNSIFEDLIKKYEALDLRNYAMAKKLSYWWGQLK